MEPENMMPTEKRHLASLARNGELRHFGIKGRRFLSSPTEKRHLGSVARAGGVGPSTLRMAGKRYLGSVVRGRMPFRLKRSVSDEFLPTDNDENYDYVDSFPTSNDYLLKDDSEEEDDLMMPMEKRHIGSIARSGWLPYIRAHRKPAMSETRLYRRNYRTSPSLSPRLSLLDWFRQEEERARDARLLEQQKQEQQREAMENAELEGKRTIASLARNGILPSSYRPSRSARDTLFWEQNPPRSRASVVNRYHFSQPRGFVKSPHAFPSLYSSSSWSRLKRSISSLARGGMLRNPSTTNTESPCKSDSGSDVGCTADDEITKRHVASLARTNQFSLGAGKRDSDDSDESFAPNSFDVEEFEENQFPYSEVGF